MKNKRFLYIFCTLTILDIFCFLFIPKLTYFTKPLIVGALLTHYIVKVPRQNQFYILALIFEMLAQVFLAFSKSVDAFLFSKICSIATFFFLIVMYKRAFTLPTSNFLKAISLLIILAFIGHIAASKIQFFGEVGLVDYVLLLIVYTFLLTAVNLKIGFKSALTYGAVLLSLAKLFVDPNFGPILVILIIIVFAFGHFLINYGLIDSYDRVVVNRLKNQ